MSEQAPLTGVGTTRRSASIAKIAAALIAAQGEMENPTKNKQNPHFKNWYADLGTVLEEVRPVFTKHRLALMQLPCDVDGEPALTTLLLHESGEWIETTQKTRAGKNDPQAVGAALSYARRYAILAIAGVAAEDNDGNDTGETAKPAPAKKAAPPTKAADPTPAPKPASLVAPISGNGLRVWLGEKEAALAKEGVCNPGQLVEAVRAAGLRVKMDQDIRKWDDAEAIKFGLEAVKAFEADRRENRVVTAPANGTAQGAAK